jgi:amino acid adenylation domain-containing protein/non-ribosomal peptide synthase protein (TIGR01720 family)
MHELFERQAERTPAAVALVSGGEELTYAELNSRANRLAHYLRARGVRADTPVGLCLERSAEMVVAMLGVLKAGGAYVPLDPEYPRERLAFMLADCGARLLLTQRRASEGLPQHAAEEVRLDADWPEIAQSPDTKPEEAAEPENLAYVIYTSGSTGRPKGVMVTHRALFNHMAWMQRRFRFAGHDRIIQKTPFSFDASVWELFAPLLVGARLVLAAPGGHQDPAYLLSFMAEQGITALKIVPSLLERLLEQEGIERCRSLRYVFCGAEAMPLKLAERFFARADAKLFNLYGPTEAAIDVTCWACEPGHGRRSIPIGNPIINTQVYVLDARMRAVPLGVSGELYVGGENLARGYLSRPELTAERFVPHPFSRTPGARLYRTGDIVRWNDEGELEYLGRNDQQVKVRGYRIETGEIEAALFEREEVGQAVVLVREEEGRGKQLAAFVCPADGVAPDGKELREHLQARLPEYMVPASIAVLERMPLTPSGKIDRQALLKVKTGEGARADEYEGARDEVEAQLAQIWQDVLGVERVGIRDNFFELGGDSIISIQIVSKANQLGLPLRVRQIFQHRTIAELAGVVRASSGADSVRQPAPDEAAGEVALTPIQRRFFGLGLLNPHHFNQAVMLAADSRPDAAALEAVLQKLVSHHASLRLRFSHGEQGWQQSYAEAETHQLLLTIDLSHLSTDEAAQRLRLDEEVAAAQAGLDISEGPLLRAALFELGAEEGWRLLLVIHHLAVDGVSWRVLLEDLQTGYGQARRGQEVRLPPPTASFGRWSRELRRYAASDELRAQLPYWTDARRREARLLPVDYEGGENGVGSVESVEVELTEEETRALLQEVPRAYQTSAEEALTAALALAFKGWTGESALLVDFEGHGREEDVAEGLDVSRTVGWFTSVYPVLLEVEGDAEAALMGVKEQLRGVPARGVGYGVLRYLSADEGVSEALEGMPEAEVSFNYLGQLDQVLDEGGEFSAAAESVGAAQGLDNGRSHLLAVNALVAGGRLRASFGYSRTAHRRETIEALAEGFCAALRELFEKSGVTQREAAPLNESQEGLLGQWNPVAGDDTSKLLVELSAGGRNAPMFFAGSYSDDPAFLFSDLAQNLGADQPVYGLWVPADDNFSYARLAARHVEEMLRVRPTGPYIVGGFSLGGLVAFEVARQLRARGEEVPLLVLLETVCTTIQRDLTLLDDGELAERIVRGHDPAFRVPEALRGRGVDERLAHILGELQAAKLIPADKDVAAFKKFLNVWRRRGDYAPEPYAGEVILFRTGDASIINENLIDMEAYRRCPAALGWDAVAARPVEIIEAPGEHSNFILAPHAAVVADMLRAHTGSLHRSGGGN